MELDLNNAPAVEAMMTEDMSSPSSPNGFLPSRRSVTFNDIVASCTATNRNKIPRRHNHRQEQQREDGRRRSSSSKARELAHDAVRTVGYISITVANVVSKSLNCSSNDTTAMTATTSTTNDKQQDLDTTAEESDEDSVSATKEEQIASCKSSHKRQSKSRSKDHHRHGSSDKDVVVDIPSLMESSRKKTRKTKSRCVITVRPTDKADQEEVKEKLKPKLCGLKAIMENNCVTKQHGFVPLDTNHELLSASGAMDDTDPMGKEFGPDAITRIMKAVNCALEQQQQEKSSPHIVVHENGAKTTNFSQYIVSSQCPRVAVNNSREKGTSTPPLHPNPPRKHGWDSESEDSYIFECESVASSTNDSDPDELFGAMIPSDGSNSQPEGHSRYDSFVRPTKSSPSSSPWLACVSCVRPTNHVNDDYGGLDTTEKDTARRNKTIMPSRLSEGIKRQAVWMRGVTDKTIAALESTHEDTMNHILSLEHAFGSTRAKSAKRRTRYHEIRKQKQQH